MPHIFILFQDVHWCTRFPIGLCIKCFHIFKNVSMCYYFLWHYTIYNMYDATPFFFFQNVYYDVHGFREAWTNNCILNELAVSMAICSKDAENTPSLGAILLVVFIQRVWKNYLSSVMCIIWKKFLQFWWKHYQNWDSLTENIFQYSMHCISFYE